VKKYGIPEIFEDVFEVVDRAQKILEEIADDILSAMSESGLPYLPYIKSGDDVFEIGMYVGRTHCTLNLTVNGVQFQIRSSDDEVSSCTEKLLSHPQETIEIIHNAETLKHLMFQAIKEYSERFREVKK